MKLGQRRTWTAQETAASFLPILWLYTSHSTSRVYEQFSNGRKDMRKIVSRKTHFFILMYVMINMKLHGTCMTTSGYKLLHVLNNENEVVM